MTRILVISLTINRPNFPQFKQYPGKSGQKISTVWAYVVLNTVNQWLLVLLITITECLLAFALLEPHFRHFFDILCCQSMFAALLKKIKLSRKTGSTAANQQRYWLIRYTLPACRINNLPAPTCHRCRCSRSENNSCCWFVWKFKEHISDCTILQLGLHILLFGLHTIGWTAPLEYALVHKFFF